MNIIRGKQARAQRVLIYGQEGVGKTTLVSNLPDVLILDTEQGADNVGCDHVQVGSIEDLRAVFKELLAEKKAGTCAYKVVALDTADRVWAMCAEEVCRSNNLKSIEDMPYGKGMKMATEQFVRVVTGGMDALANAGFHVVVCAHSKVERISPPDNAEYTQYQVKVSAPGKQAEEAAANVKQWADAVLFCHFRTSVNATTGKALSEERVVATTHSAQWEAKNRFGLKDELPMDAKELAALFPDLGGKAAQPAHAGVDAGGGAAPAAAAAPVGAAGGGVAAAAAPAPRDIVEATTQPVAVAPVRGMNSVPATGSAPGELGFQEPVKRPELETTKPEVKLPEDLQGYEADLCAYLVSKGQLKAGQGVQDISEKMMARIWRNPNGVLEAILQPKK